SLSSIILAGFLSVANGCFQWLTFMMAIFTTVFLQVLSNLANDYGDSIHGADTISSRKGPKRMVTAGNISREAMKRAIILCSVLAFVSGLVLLWVAGVFSVTEKWLFFLLLGVLSIAAAILYTNGKRPYGYIGLGDIAVFFFFGIVGVEGSYYLLCGSLDWLVLLPAASVGFFATGVLNVNNIRDIESDRLAGKYSIPVRLGLEKARIYHLFLITAGVACACVYTFLNFHSFVQWIFLVSLIPLAFHLKATFVLSNEKFDPLLKKLALSTLFFCITFGCGLIF
ncbi:MAG: 1,4-dihydroxy-2-naphthoate octaprenyltransferase, partial [Cytophagales bacterium]|nr:1,4-dihydroxy-2-naphthoate octaprenyltransferase [Cytophagales bacterium]